MASRKLGRPQGPLLGRQGVDLRRDGPDQIEESRQHWGVERFDLLQVHNLLSWETHLPTAAGT